jgi:hypothetical protein
MPRRGDPSVVGVRCGPGPVRGVAQREDVGVPRVGVAPAQVVLQPPGQRRMVGVVRGAHDEAAQRPELGLDRVGPGRVGRGQAQFDVVGCGPGADLRGLVGREVVHDHVDGCAVRASRPDRLQRGQRVIAALAAPGHAPELVVAEAVAAVEVPDAVRAGVGSPATASASTRAPRSSRGMAGSTGTRTDRRRSSDPGTGWSLPRCDRAWRPCPGRGTPSTSACAETTRAGSAGSGAAARG